MPSDWGPPGFETPPPRQCNMRLIAAVSSCLVTLVGVPWCQEHVGSIDLMTGNKSCPDGAVRGQDWAGRHYHTRRAEEIVNLQKWIARYPGRLNKQLYGAFCDRRRSIWPRGSGGRTSPVHCHRCGRGRRSAERAWATGRFTPVGELRPSRGRETAAGPRRRRRGARPRGGKTPLHTAALGLGDQSTIDARIEVARLLLAAGANVNAREPGSGFTPLRYATSRGSGNTAMAAVLLSYGADPSGAESQTSAPVSTVR